MGVLPETLLLVQLNMEESAQDIIIKERNSSNGSIWNKPSIEEEENNRDKANSCSIRRRRRRRSKSLAQQRRRSSARIVQRVSTLRNLVPNNDSNDEGSLEQLFTQTADYILSLQTRVRFMKTLVDVLSGSSSSSSSSIDE